MHWHSLPPHSLCGQKEVCFYPVFFLCWSLRVTKLDFVSCLSWWINSFNVFLLILQVGCGSGRGLYAYQASPWGWGRLVPQTSKGGDGSSGGGSSHLCPDGAGHAEIPANHPAAGLSQHGEHPHTPAVLHHTQHDAQGKQSCSLWLTKPELTSLWCNQVAHLYSTVQLVLTYSAFHMLSSIPMIINLPHLPGFSGALPHSRSHHAVPTAEQQGAPVDSGEWGAGDISPASGFGLLPAPPWLLPGGHCDTTPLPAPRGGVHRPKEPQVRHEVAVGDLGVRCPPFLLCPLFCSLLLDHSFGGTRGCHVVHSHPIIATICDKESVHKRRRRGSAHSFLLIDHHGCCDIKLWSARWLSKPGIKQMPWLLFFCVVESLSFQHVVKTFFQKGTFSPFASYFCCNHWTSLLCWLNTWTPEEGDYITVVTSSFLCLKNRPPGAQLWLQRWYTTAFGSLSV